LRRHLALEQLTEPARELDDFQAALHLSRRIGQHLPVLTRDDFRQLVAMGVHQLAEAEEHSCAPAQRRRCPAGGSFRRCAHRLVDKLCGRMRHARDHFAGRRLGDIGPALLRAGARRPPTWWLKKAGSVIVVIGAPRRGCS